MVYEFIRLQDGDVASLVRLSAIAAMRISPVACASGVLWELSVLSEHGAVLGRRVFARRNAAEQAVNELSELMVRKEVLT